MSLHRLGRALALIALLTFAGLSFAQEFVQWEFDGTLASSTGGAPLMPQISSPAFEFLEIYDELDINGGQAEVLYFERGVYFRAMGGFSPNGGGAYVNRYTIIVDVMFPDRSSSGGWTAIYNTNVAAPPANDAEAFIDPAGAIGTGGVYAGLIEDGEWYRIAIAVDLAQGTITFYIDGAQVNQVAGGLDGRHSLWSIDDGDIEGFSLFGDNNEENSEGYINSLQFWNTALPPHLIAALGGPAAEGIPDPADVECFVRNFSVEFDRAAGNVVCAWESFPGDGGFRILRDGAQLGGDLGAGVTSFIDMDPPVAGRGVVYTLARLDGGAVAAECPIAIDTFACVADLQCCVDQTAGSATLTWMPAANVGYSDLEIIRDGSSIGTVGPGDSEYVDEGVPEGVHTWEIAPLGAEPDPCAADPVACRASVLGTAMPSAPPCGGVIARWDFDGDLSSSTGQEGLEAIGYPGVASAPGVTFLEDTIAGEDADVASFTRGTAFVVRHGLDANGGGIYVNRYTLIMDVKFPEISSWISLYQTNDQLDLSQGNDGDWFVNPDNFGIGILGNYGGAVQPDAWHRLALVYDTVAGTYTSYIDGVEAQQNRGHTTDDRWTLYARTDATPHFILFADETIDAAEMGAGLVNSVQIRDYPLSAGEVAALGGPSAEGIPLAPSFVCPSEVSCCADQDAGTVTLSWSGAVNMPGFAILRDGEEIGTAAGGANSYTDTEVEAGEHVYELLLEGGVAGPCGNFPLSCSVSLIAERLFFDDFDCYSDDGDLEAAGWERVDVNGATESSTWTAANPLSRVNPPGPDGTPTSGNFVISDSEFGANPDGANANLVGSGMSHDLISPPFSTLGATDVWLHADVIAQLNNNGDAVFDVDVSVGGGDWVNVFRRVSPGRSVEPAPDLGLDNTDGVFGRVDIDLSEAAANASEVRLRFRHFEPTWEWFIAIDNVLVDENPATGGSAVLLAAEDFGGGIPADWATLAGEDSDGFSPWTTEDVWGRSLLLNGAGFPDVDGGRQLHHFDENFAIVDVRGGGGLADELLVTLPVDCSEFARVFLHVKSAVLAVGGETAEILLSLDGGESFEEAPVLSYSGGGLSVAGEEPYFNEYVLEVPRAAGEEEVALAFHYDTNGSAGEGWWAIDDVEVTADLAAGERPFVRGDADSSGQINLSDGIVVLNWLFLGGPEPACLDASDTDDAGGVNLTDAVRIFNWLFTGGPAPLDPSPSSAEYLSGDCGSDPVAGDSMGCARASPKCQ